MNVQTIKSYLVKLGVQVDDGAFNRTHKTINDLERKVSSMFGKISKSSIAGAGTVISSLVAIDAAIVGMIKKTIDADLSYELLAKKMFLSTDAAKAFKLASDALGASMHEIAWNAELKAQYFDLVRMINNLKTPPEARRMFKEVRALGFEFKRLKVASKSAIEMISYHLLQANEGVFKDLREYFLEKVELFITKMPEWTKIVADFLQVPIELSLSLIEVGKSLWDVGGLVLGVFKELWQVLPSMAKELVMVGGGLAMFTFGSPFLKGLSTVAGLLTAIDDAMAFKEGRESLKILVPLWEGFELAALGVNAAVVAATVAIRRHREAKEGIESPLSYRDEVKQELGLLTLTYMERTKERRDKAIAAEAERKGIPIEEVNYVGLGELSEIILGDDTWKRVMEGSYEWPEAENPNLVRQKIDWGKKQAKVDRRESWELGMPLSSPWDVGFPMYSLQWIMNKLFPGKHGAPASPSWAPELQTALNNVRSATPPGFESAVSVAGANNVFNMNFDLSDQVTPEDLSDALVRFTWKVEEEARNRDINNRVKQKMGIR